MNKKQVIVFRNLLLEQLNWTANKKKLLRIFPKFLDSYCFGLIFIYFYIRICYLC